MLTFALVFWLVVFVAVSAGRRRRWRRWAMTGPYGYPPSPWAWERGGWPDWARRPDGPRVRGELEEDRSTIEALETRIAQLEERLDFTERLLAERSKRPADA